ncbi:hypothetical protein M427DRAFT_56845 [Gonapodya prolifera JEL478]|uniref:Metallo-dependent hydrolase n=1 Tax=Gonapodya prolifera (strain JEL478) TaxID=1344416 RepID=A0A139AFM5_GONPJ|nr:hypothetical protein M427DRAFT_56845 [Gonapodya prolifera JEL478]|eukprot:KXS15213.1 hypothetical protein M427DRAFT_56845 [Gonapodya prolifera JEL478]
MFRPRVHASHLHRAPSSLFSRHFSHPAAPAPESAPPATVLADQPELDLTEDQQPAFGLGSLPIIHPTRQFLESDPSLASEPSKFGDEISPHTEHLAVPPATSKTGAGGAGSVAVSSGPVPIVDTHTHLAEVFYRKRLPVSEVAWMSLLASYKHNELKHAAAPRVQYFINIASDPSAYDLNTHIAQFSPRISTVYGCHPLAAHKYTDTVHARLEELVKAPDCVGVGEAGLNYVDDVKLEKATRFLQRTVFESQVDMAARHGKTLVVHSRGGDADVLSILKSARQARPPRVVVHNYTGSVELAREILDVVPEAHFGVSGFVTFGVTEADGVRALARYLPLETILLESVAPYIAPEPHRQRVNHSGLLPFIAERIAREKGLNVEDIYTAAWENSLKAFPGIMR